MILVPGSCLTFVVLLWSFLVNSISPAKHGHSTNNPNYSTYYRHKNTSTTKYGRKSTKSSNIGREIRSPQFDAALSGLRRPAQIGLGQLGLSYSPRLPALGLQGPPALPPLGQYRSLIPQNNAFVSNNAGYRLPYNYQLARLLSTINLLRERSALASAVKSAGLDLYKPKRLKYDSIPIKPTGMNAGLDGNALSLLLGSNSLGSKFDNNEEEDNNDNGGFCSPNPCHNNGKCKSRMYHFECVCRNGFTGNRCTGRNPCDPNPCQYDGECNASGTSFECSCLLGRKGERCEDEDRCHPNPCMNGGTCTELSNGHECTCVHGYRGQNCEERSGRCSNNPCQNDGHCVETTSGFECICKPGFAGTICSASQNKCLLNPCLNGGRCLQTLSETGYECDCLPGYKGMTCVDENPCHPGACHNGGTCFESADNSFKCICQQGFGGKHCEAAHHNCQIDTCKNGARCIEHENGFKCVCPSGYRGLYCEGTNQCHSNPCLHDGECIETEEGYKCRCQTQFKGIHCENLDLCAANPCKNGGQCLSYDGGFKCLCQTGYKGINCQDKSTCEPNPCHNDGECIQDGDTSKCSCKMGYAGIHCKVEDSCLSDPCQNGGTCKSVEGGFACTCSSNYKGKYCNEKEPCHPNPCGNNGKCISTPDGFICRCTLGFKGQTCSDEDECQPNPCENGGRCNGRFSGGGFDCECTAGFRGTACKEKDPCHPDPCANNGVCAEIGGGITCNCTQGYKGSTCEELDRCHPNPCKHGGDCKEVVGGQGFVCQCSQSYKGSKCEVKDRCHPNPCLHDGYCLEINNDLGFLCNCSTGFRGSHCQAQDPCHPNPCSNAGSCLHTNDGSFVCNCSIGFKGLHCQDKDLCKPNPCQFGDKCLQTGTDSYQCVKNVCDPNPCQHGGRCIEVNDDDYQCACSSQYVGKICNKKTTESKPTESPNVEYCSPSPCKNNGVCVQEKKGYSCVCKSGFTGFHCQVDPCASNPCNDNGKCIRDRKAGYKCRCLHGFVGKQCDENYCLPNPCHNSGVCLSIPDKGYQCKCRDGFTGDRCDRSPCFPNPCRNGGSCLVFYTVYLCKCPRDYRGTHCEVTLANKLASNYVTGIKKEETSRPAHSHAPKASSCTPNPCRNNAVCLDTIGGGYECFCRGDFSGPVCEDIGEYTYSSAPKFFPGKGEECKHCDRFAHCVVGHCICRNGYVGDGLDCWEEKLEDREWTCVVNPCQNGGTCKPGIANCVCRLGYIGKYCEEQCPPSIHLSFDKVSTSTLLDDSGYNNNAIMVNGAQIAPHSGKCGNAVNLLGGDILMDGSHFKNIPRKGITIATWIKLETNLGVQSIFVTVGSHSSHRDGQYHLEIDNGKVRWFHRDENHQTIFSVVSRRAITQGNWTQLTVTYSSIAQRARVFVNGDMIAEEKGHGLLSQDWAGKAGIGKHQHEYGSRLLRGMVDEFFIFPGELPRLEILVLMRHCKVYFAKTKIQIVKPLSNVPDIKTTIKQPLNEYQAATKLRPQSNDKIVNHLEQILQSFEKDKAPVNRQQTISSVSSQSQRRLKPFSHWSYIKPYQARARPIPNPSSVTSTGLLPQSYRSYLSKNPEIQQMTPQQVWPRPMITHAQTSLLKENIPYDNNIPYRQFGLETPSYIKRFRSSRMQSPLVYSINPPARPPHGRASSTSRMRAPLTYLNGVFVPVRPAPDTQFAADSSQSHVANNRWQNEPLTRRHYPQYRISPKLTKSATGVLNNWLDTAPPLQHSVQSYNNRVPLKSSQFNAYSQRDTNAYNQNNRLLTARLQTPNSVSYYKQTPYQNRRRLQAIASRYRFSPTAMAASHIAPSSRRIKVHPETKQEKEDERELAEALALLSLPSN